ncbi:MAG: penicillin-binding protein, partial [Acidimicrobiales bacterium]
VITPDESAKVVYCLQQVLVSGTAAGKGLGSDSAGKTGTTDNNADGWFVGFTPGQLTTAVWMGYPDVDPTTGKLRTMPRGVDGGTYPTDIWHDFMTQALQNSPHPQFPAAADVNGGNAADSGGAVTSAPSPSPTSPRSSTPRPSTSTTVRETTSTSAATKPSVTVPGGGGGGGGGPGH